MNLTPSFLLNPKRKEAIGLVLLKTREICSLGRSLLMIPRRSSPPLLSDSQLSKMMNCWEEQTPDLNLGPFVYTGTNRPMSTLSFDCLLVRTFLLPPQENGEHSLLTILLVLKIYKLPEKITLHQDACAKSRAI